MKKIRILCILLVLFLLSGCTPKGNAEVRLYFADGSGLEIAEEIRKVQDDGNLPETAVRSLLEGPRERGLSPCIPVGTELLGLKMNGTVAEVNLSAPFDTGTDAERLLARYTVIYTVCAVPGVQKVKLLAEGAPLTSLRTGTPLGALGTADVSLAGPGGGTPLLATLYFADPTGTYLLPESRQITLAEGDTPERAIVTEVIRGPASSGLISTLSPATAVLSAETYSGTCFVNMNRAFLENGNGSDTQVSAAVYSIVNALCTVPEIESVRFLVEGETVEKLGSLALSDRLTENKSLYPPA